MHESPLISSESNENEEVEKSIVTGLCLIPERIGDNLAEIKFRINSVFQTFQERIGNIAPFTKEELLETFRGIRVQEPDKICRPKGQTTIFTSAGVQHIETILETKGDLDKDVFTIHQPVIRSQYMDKVKSGTSTAFVNFSVEALNTNISEFNSLCKKMFDMVIKRGVLEDQLMCKIETLQDKWGNREFKKTVLTLFVNNIEIGEGVFIHDYPIDGDKKIAIADICFGVERLNWAIDSSQPYFSEFEDFYLKCEDANLATSIIDCIRTAVLLAGEGVVPSHVDPGFRLRRLSKKFVERNKMTNFNVRELVEISWKYWLDWGFRPDLDKETVINVLENENTRSYNAMILLLIEHNGGLKVNININQTTEAFVQQLQISVPAPIKEILTGVLKTLNI